jgi:hypothetical protein
MTMRTNEPNPAEKLQKAAKEIAGLIEANGGKARGEQ